ncbi:MAG TPA: DUF1254 domain-containing protein, partial [Gammaproteobacteria bacterium]|nr:DUF1254 domain-containing protein [Gammaproteobacteria bacterium]
SPTHSEVPPDAARTIAGEAFIYGFPMGYAYRFLNNQALDRRNPEFRAPFNEMGCQARLLTAKDQTMPGPNADTPYCIQWLDLRSEPLVLRVPAIDPERFFDFELEDFYTHNIGYVGTLWTGNAGGEFLIAGPGWEGAAPDGIAGVFRSDTDLVFTISRIQLYGPDDLENVARLQEGFALRPLSAYRGETPPEPAPAIDFPAWEQGAQYDERLFGYLDFLLPLLGEPFEEDAPLWERMERIGIGAERRFDFGAMPPEIQEALQDGARQGWAEIERFIEEQGDDPLFSTKVLGDRAFLQRSARENFDRDSYYLIRAAAAELGVFGNIAREAMYPVFLTDADGDPLDAAKHAYTLTFAPGELPPVRGFWSLTMYDDRMLFVDNPLDRYLLNSTMLDGFRRAPDGSLTFHIARDSPGPALEANWLPAPDGPFRMLMRLYGPGEDAREGRWRPPRPEKHTGAGAGP